MKNLFILLFAFTLFSSCTIEVIDEDCGVVTGRTEYLENGGWSQYITIVNDRGDRQVFLVDSNTYYSTFLGEYVCLR